jgi:hypothetical protein
VDTTPIRTLVNEYKTDASGRIELPFSADDPDTDKGAVNTVTLDFDVTLNADDSIGTVDTESSGLMPDDDSGLVENDADTDAMVSWTDAKSKASNLSISQSVTYHEASKDASGVRHTVQATLVDQYGDPVRGVKVRFWSDANNRDDDDANDGLGGLDRDADGEVMDDNSATDEEDESAAATGSAEDYADERTTNRRGVATKFYNRDSEASQVETITAAFNLNPGDGQADGDGDDTDMDFDDTGETITAMHFWAVEADDDSEITGDTVVAIDTDSNMLVVRNGSTNTVWIVNYDSNDQFSVGSGDDPGAVTASVFESTLADGSDDEVAASTLNVAMAEDPGDGVNKLTNTNGTVPDAPDCP